MFTVDVQRRGDLLVRQPFGRQLDSRAARWASAPPPPRRRPPTRSSSDRAGCAQPSARERGERGDRVLERLARSAPLLGAALRAAEREQATGAVESQLERSSSPDASRSVAARSTPRSRRGPARRARRSAWRWPVPRGGPGPPPARAAGRRPPAPLEPLQLDERLDELRRDREHAGIEHPFALAVLPHRPQVGQPPARAPTRAAPRSRARVAPRARPTLLPAHLRELDRLARPALALPRALRARPRAARGSADTAGGTASRSPRTRPTRRAAVRGHVEIPGAQARTSTVCMRTIAYEVRSPRSSASAHSDASERARRRQLAAPEQPLGRHALGRRRDVRGRICGHRRARAQVIERSARSARAATRAPTARSAAPSRSSARSECLERPRLGLAQLARRPPPPRCPPASRAHARGGCGLRRTRPAPARGKRS